MHSYVSFTPGGKTKTSRMIRYVANRNAAYDPGKLNTCFCIPDKYDKNTPGTFTSSINASTILQIAQRIRFIQGGKTQYVGGPSTINLFSRREGMSGGSGAPPVNRFY